MYQIVYQHRTAGTGRFYGSTFSILEEAQRYARKLAELYPTWEYKVF